MGKGIGKLTSKAILGFYFLALEGDLMPAWVSQISPATPYPSNENSEEYGWLGQAPGLRDWVGGRKAKGFKDYSHVIKNGKKESTIRIDVADMRQDKTGQLQTRVNDQVGTAQRDWAKDLTTLIIAGESQNCYDGQYYFDTDHPVSESTDAATTQSNDLTNSIVLKTAPTVAEMSDAIYGAIQALYAFNDDQGEPMNENAMNFMVMVPTSFLQVANAAIADKVIQGTSGTKDNSLVNQTKFTVEVVVNPRLTWTDRFAVFRTDSQIPALIRQEEEPLTPTAKAEGSDFEHDYDAHEYGLKTNRGSGFGLWQFACLHTFTTT